MLRGHTYDGTQRITCSALDQTWSALSKVTPVLYLSDPKTLHRIGNINCEFGKHEKMLFYL